MTSPQFEDIATLVRQGFDPTPPPEVEFAIVVVDRHGHSHQHSLDGFEPQRVLIGTSEVCELRLDDPEVSRRQAALELEHDRVRIVDLESTNGTRVNGVLVREAFLFGGELVRVGATDLHIQRLPRGRTDRLPSETHFGRVVGASSEMRRLYPLLHRLAPAEVPVLIEGETGTGKELLAEELHAMSTRRDEPFVVFDCTAIPANLMESELFGHERGAFTGASAQRKGLFELADRGTLFIDEIGELEPALQPKLLRALERLEVRRLGSGQPIRVDVRVIAATNRNLEVEVREKRFREDLYHRLVVTRVELPPLRRRRGDVGLLARHIHRSLGGDDHALDPATLARWEVEEWPGNVRQLRNAVVRFRALGALAHEPGPSLTEAPDLVQAILAKRLPLAEARHALVQEFERRYVSELLAEHGGNVRKAAEAAGVARRYFQQLKNKPR